MTIITPTGITGINSITSSGSTLSFQNVSGGNINVSGVNISSGTNINISGVSTFTNGPVLIGSGTSTGTTSQPLQVSGGAYVSDNLGIGLTNPFSKLDIRYSSSTAYSTTASPQTVNAITLLNTNTTATTTFSGIALGNARNGNTAFVGIECVGTGNDTTALAFKTQSAGPVFAEAARIDSSGNFKLSTAGTKILNSSGNPILQQTGSILQVVQTVKTDTFSVTGFTWTDVTGLSAAITPSSSSSKILVMVEMKVGSNIDYSISIRLLRNSTNIYLGDLNGSRTQVSSWVTTYINASSPTYGFAMIPASIIYLDSPATTGSTTYKIQMASYSSNISYVNRSHQWQQGGASGYDGCPPSSITLMEVSA